MDLTTPILFVHRGTRNLKEKVAEIKIEHWEATYTKDRNVELKCTNPELDIKVLSKSFCLWCVALHNMKFHYADPRAEILMVTFVSIDPIYSEPLVMTRKND